MSDSEIEVQIAMVVDNELTTSERAELIAALDLAPQLWRACAIAFMDEQFLKKSFAADHSSASSSAAIAHASDSQGSPTRNALQESEPKLTPAKQTLALRHSKAPSPIGWITLALLLGLGIGLLGNAATDMGNRIANQMGWHKEVAPKSESSSEDELLLASVASFTNLANEAEALVANFELPTEPTSMNSTKSVRLFEIQNDERRAVYYSSDAIPEFILESMVMAGHEVEVTNEKLRTPVGGDQIVNLPVFAMRINKSPDSVNQP